MKNSIDKELNYSTKIELIKTPLFNFISSRIYNREDAKDVLQNTLFILIQNKINYNPDKSFYSWSFAICRFQIKKFLTQKKRNREDNAEFFGDLVCDASSPPHLILQNKEDEFHKKNIISKIKSKFLSPRELEFYLLFEKGKDRSSIMSLMNIKKCSYYQYRNRIADRFFKNLHLVSSD